MVVPKAVKQKAFGMYILGISGGRISNLLGIKNSTVYKWITNEDWEKSRIELENTRKEHSSFSTNEQDLKLLESVLALWVEAVKDKRDHLKEHIRPKDLTETIKMRRLLRGETTENISVNNEVMSVKEEVKKILEGRDE